ncbi:MAG: hypothetical protein E7394_03675 [Ruminococcaceae bacterium]|nr:hypothetical protein [Oscillospiraceae bacterium]
MLKNKELDRRTALAINNLGKRIGKTVVFAEELYDSYGNIQNSHAGIVENLEAVYSKHLKGDAQIDADFIEEEFTSSALSYLFSDAKNVKKFAQENFNGFQRVVDNVIHVFEKNISMYEGRDKSVRDMYEPIIDKLKEQKKSIIQRYDDGISGKVDNDIYSDLYKQSIVSLASGEKFVKASRQVIKSESPEDWGNDVMKYINREIRNGKYVSFTGMDGHKLFITRDTAGKARFRNIVEEKHRKKEHILTMNML